MTKLTIIRTLIAIGLGIFYTVGGAYMLLDSDGWLSFMVGRRIEGPLPFAHFIHDTGLAFIASAFGFLFFAARSNYWPAAAVAATFPALHAAMHAMAMIGG